MLICDTKINKSVNQEDNAVSTSEELYYSAFISARSGVSDLKIIDSCIPD